MSTQPKLADDQLAADSIKHEVLSLEDRIDPLTKKPFVNYSFLIDDSGSDTNQIKQIVSALTERYCSNQVCNQLYFWRNREAYDQLMYKRKMFKIENYNYNKAEWQKAESDWKDKNWSFVCENLIATYDANSGELEYEPYLDSEYREHGGKQMRPGQLSTMIGKPNQLTSK